MFVGLAGDYIYIRADGDMHHYAPVTLVIHGGDGGPHGFILPGYRLSLDEEVKSEESCFVINLGYRFGTK
ncbi:MAG TPA: hypothetical protein PKM41_02285 [Deltaproteobacteria bacterium]|nr:hypothetical protein [Deltaproteobacteria bacterium]HOI05638.1 hypothetical protein [Deltaproteobacteria bacterium]